MHITALDHIVLRVTDIDRSLAFYHDLLGLAVERLDEYRAGRAPFPSVRVGPDTVIDLVVTSTPADPTSANLDHFCLVVDDLAAAQERLTRAGRVIEAGPVPRWGARGMATAIYLRDPDGNLVELRAYPATSTRE